MPDKFVYNANFSSGHYLNGGRGSGELIRPLQWIRAASSKSLDTSSNDDIIIPTLSRFKNFEHLVITSSLSLLCVCVSRKNNKSSPMRENGGCYFARAGAAKRRRR